MRVDSFMQSLRVLVHADSMIADITFRNRLSQITLYFAAFLIVMFGLLMLGIAGYQSLLVLWGPVWAGVATALGSFVVAALIMVVAAYRKPGKELQMAREMHSVALDSLIAETKLVGNGFSLINNVLHGRIDSTLLGLIGPLAMLLLRFMKKTPKADAE